jgi:hypothetical protein
LYKSRKLYHWAYVLSGKYLDVDQEIDFSKYCGLNVRIRVSKHTDKNGVEYNKVDDLIEVVIDPYEGKKPDFMSYKAWTYSREYLERHKKLLRSNCYIE